VAYQAEPAALPTSTVTLTVFDASSDDTAIQIASAVLVILGLDPSTQVAQVLETVKLHNGGKHTFLPSTDGPRGPMGLLRFGLPKGAGNLTPDGRLGASTIIQVDTGFATNLPVPPGDTEVSYSYEIAYGALSDGGYVSLSKNLPYPTDLLRVLAVPGDFIIQSEQLIDQGVDTVGSRQYRRMEGRNLPAHGELSLELRKLPLILPVLRSSNPWLQLVMGLLLLVAVTFPLIYARRYRYKSRALAAGAPASASSKIGNEPPTAEGAPGVRPGARRAPVNRGSRS
jgi:hypothetical protein